jgi:hypothetical protein
MSLMQCRMEMTMKANPVLCNNIIPMTDVAYGGFTEPLGFTERGTMFAQ